jgi:hypothetical protein
MNHLLQWRGFEPLPGDDLFASKAAAPRNSNA